MSTINRGIRTASRTLRTPAFQSRVLRTPLLTARANFTASPRTPSTRQFSVMAARQSGAPPPPQAREYDPEIKDIASYVHNTPINSDLAVSYFPAISAPQNCVDRGHSSILLDLFSSILWVAVSKVSDLKSVRSFSDQLLREPSFQMARKSPVHLSNWTLSMAPSISVL